MASFFQPSNLFGAPSSARKQDSRFAVYTNSTLSRNELFTYWYQYLCVSLAATCLLLPIARWTYQAFRYRRWRRAQKEKAVRSDVVDAGKSTRPRRSSCAPSCLTSPKSFGYYAGPDVGTFLSRSYDIHILDTQRSSVTPMSCESEKSSSDLLAYVSTPDSQAGKLSAIRGELCSLKCLHGFAGLALPATFMPPSRFNDLLGQLVDEGLAVVLMVHPDETALGDIDFRLVAGVVFLNACILRNGMRRDYFQALELREGLGRCDRQRKLRPSFFVGFLDLWDERPSPAVIRRSHKFAKHHNAVLSIGPALGVTDVDRNLPSGEVSLSSFDWLKRQEIIELQKAWSGDAKPVEVGVGQRGLVAQLDLNVLRPVLPNIDVALQQRTKQPLLERVSSHGEILDVIRPQRYKKKAPPRPDFWETTSHGETMCDRGCYDLREEILDQQYAAVLETQRHLRELDMLCQVDQTDRFSMCLALEKLVLAQNAGYPLLESLIDGLKSGQILVLKGLDSGFTLPDNRAHVWGVSQDQESDGVIVMYISQKAPDILGTIVHTYLAHKGISRVRRFEIEWDLFRVRHTDPRVKAMLIPRVECELRGSTYSELLMLMEQLRITKTAHPILGEVEQFCEYILLTKSSLMAWNRTHSQKYLEGTISSEQLLATRLKWYEHCGAKALPELRQLVLLFSAVEDLTLEGLYRADRDLLATFSAVLLGVYTGGPTRPFVDINADLFALMFFCALRKFAFEDVYLETTDRCPLFLQQDDQAAVFAELWVLGSQCEIYFGIRPRALGTIIHRMRREESVLFSLPKDAWDAVDVMTAYHKVDYPKVEEGVGTGVGDTTDEPKESSRLRRRFAKFGFLTIFCVPAIIDVLLLTFLGRGLYLTAFMTPLERVMANYALLTALLVTAGVTGWAGSTGGYYLYNHAFDNMNYFLVQRLSGGFVLASIISLCGFVAFGLEYSWYGGFIFVAYMMAISIYLNLLGIMSTMHRDNSPLPSGRGALYRCMLILLISPVLTSFVNGYDIIVYLLILYTFVLTLLFSFRRLCHSYSSWLDKIILIKEKDIVAWYEEVYVTENEKAVSGTSTSENETPLSTRARTMLMQQIHAIRSRRWWRRSLSIPEDGFVKKLAEGYDFAIWLLLKDDSEAKLPEPYTSTWLVQLELVLKNQRQMEQGLVEHSPFILYRYSKFDMGQNVGLFLVALLDRWIAITMSARANRVNLYFDVKARYGSACGLIYFLLCAITLDSMLQHYWGTTGRRSDAALGSIEEADTADMRESSREKRRWLKAFKELIWRMLFIFGLMTMFLWLFVQDYRSIISYFFYIAGYSGVIFFQFNRVFTTDIRKHIAVVFAAASVVYLAGIILNALAATVQFRYLGVLCLCGASWSAALGTWLLSDFCDDAPVAEPGALEDLTNWKLYSQRLVGCEAARPILITGDSNNVPRLLDKIGGTKIAHNDGTEMSSGIDRRLAEASQDTTRALTVASPKGPEILRKTIDQWEAGYSEIKVVQREFFAQFGIEDRFAIGISEDGFLKVYLGMPALREEGDKFAISEEEVLVEVLAEALIHETCEASLAMSHQEATLAELLIHDRVGCSTRMRTQINWTDSPGLHQLIRNTNNELLKHLCFGIDINVCWEEVPEDVRKWILARIREDAFLETDVTAHWLYHTSTDAKVKDLCLEQCLYIYETALETLISAKPLIIDYHPSRIFDLELLPAIAPERRGLASSMTRAGKLAYRLGTNLVQFVAIVSTAGTGTGRELWYLLRSSRSQMPVLWGVLKVWKICWWVKQAWTYLLLVSKKAHFRTILDLAHRGVARQLKTSSITVNDYHQPVSGFLVWEQDFLSIQIYQGVHDVPPKAGLNARAQYSPDLRLQTLTEYVTGKYAATPVSTTSEYQYKPGSASSRWPISKSVNDGVRSPVVYYDEYGRITQGRCVRDDMEFQFYYVYKRHPKANNKVLKAIYIGMHPGNTMIYSVFWCTPPIDETWSERDWISSEKIRRLVVTYGHETWDTTWVYNHKQHPVLSTIHISPEGRVPLEKPSEHARNDKFGFLKRPKQVSFDQEDLLIHHHRKDVRAMHSFSSAASSPAARLPRSLAVTGRNVIASIGRLLGIDTTSSHVKTVYRKPSTGHLRTELWQQWNKLETFDAMTSCYVDELLLRAEPSLGRYWRLRDAGYFASAKDYLSTNLDEIVAAVEVADDVSQTSPLTIKLADLFVMGLAKDANQLTNRLDDCFADTEDRLSVIFTDTGCWPDAPGGVSNCRRDLVNGHSTIRNHVMAESANDYGIPRYQTERNVQSMKTLPLWGLDGKTPFHGLFDNLLQMEVDERIHDTQKRDIIGTFIPLMKMWVRGARSIRLTRNDLLLYTNVVLNINHYFSEKDYNTTWRSKEVLAAWREAWLYDYEDPNIPSANERFDIERPTMKEFQDALELYICYFFIFSVRVPKTCPHVFQSTHHGIGSLWGMCLKYRKGLTLGIWDHAIMWRESCLNVSPAQSILPVPVLSMLLAGMKLAAHLAYTHVDVALPCTGVYNPIWEADIGTDEGHRGSIEQFKRKIDPITNGIGNMKRFSPITTIRSKYPTVIMLSNVQFIKDVKNAVFAADVIINDFGFKSYNLWVYGAKDRQPSYALETEDVIVSRGLTENVKLAGFGSPKEVFKDAWLFMNSSLSEGLPLAIGEAALSGVPIVATEVGATAEVLTDADDPSIRYGEVVPPNDPVSLARAQISLLAMLGPWTKYTTDATPPPPALPEKFTPHDVEWITQRMHDKTADRQALGMKLREVVLRKFHGDRYLREHEQMYWIHKHRASQRASTQLSEIALAHPRFGQPFAPAFRPPPEDDGTGGERWQQFPPRKQLQGVANAAHRRRRPRNVSQPEDLELADSGGGGDDHEQEVVEEV